MRLSGLQQSDYGWLAVAAVVVAVEIAGADNEQMLSHATVRYNAAHPIVTTSFVLTTAAHLLDVLPEPVDPFHQTFRLISWLCWLLRRLRRQKIHPATPAISTAASGT